MQPIDNIVFQKHVDARVNILNGATNENSALASPRLTLPFFLIFRVPRESKTPDRANLFVGYVLVTAIRLAENLNISIDPLLFT
ncbi:hypothetical protein J437_LFUL012472 [Ladona fulva]|uniref:Uncharacterized protein n=1 Tax=Ladona fulva TaxID=123851 RepID=A0A8K0NYH2_LADFU|nr:hypothetical protein J437_LFUL012472 [Ladona fulva]